MIYILIITIVIVYLIISTYFVKIKHNIITSDIKNDFKFVHISDIHGTVKFINGRLSSIINKISPDFVVVTGDLSNNHKQLIKVLDELSNISAKNGIITILGNYELDIYSRNTNTIRNT